jgi:hypothetical protein
MLQFVLPTKTTCTLANLFHNHQSLYYEMNQERDTYAAVAAKFSNLFASVTKLKHTLKTAVNAHKIPSLAAIFLTNESTIIAAIGISDEMRVPIIVAMRWKCVSR